MKIIISIKAILLILLLCLPTTILISLITTDVYAAERDIPEENYKNEWHWHDDIKPEELLIYEVEVYGKNLTNGKMIVMSKELRIYNITGFSNETSQFGFGNISRVYGTWNYHNCTSDKLIPEVSPFDEDPHIIGGFGFNNSGIFREYYEAEQYSINCILLPINGSKGLEVDVMANIINSTFLDIYYQAGMVNGFDYSITKTATDNNSIYFKDTSSHYFINTTYYDNGTLRYYEGSYFVYQGEDSLIEYNFTMKRVFNYNITDEIEWDVEVGDRLYYGWNSGDLNEIELLITSFEDDVIQVVGSSGPMYQCFETILANLSAWNPSLGEYEFVQENYTIGTANNFYPMCLGVNYPIIMPKNTEIEDIKFQFNNSTHEYQPYFPFDEVQIKSENGKIKFLLGISNDENAKANFIYNEATGISDLLEIHMMGGKQVIYRKNMTIVTNQAEAEKVLLYSDLVGNNEVYLNFTYISNEDFEFYWAILPVNPIFIEFPYEIYSMPLYIDVYMNTTSYRFAKPINITLHYDDSMLSQDMEYNLAPYYYDIYSEQWIKVPEIQITLDTDANIIVVSGIEGADFTVPLYFALGIEEWTWGIDVDDLLIIQPDVGAYDIDTLELIMGFKEFYIFTITSIENVIKEYLEEKHQIFSQVNFVWLYYDTYLQSLEWNPNDPYGEPSIMMEFCANSSATFPLKFGDQNLALLIPYILPLRFGKLNLSILGPVLKETHFDLIDGLPIWDVVIADDTENTLYFYNSTYGYYLDLAYYENGTIKNGAAYYSMTEAYIYNGTFNRPFDYNLTSEVEWSVKPGDDLYFGDMDKEIKCTIVEINETTVNMNYIGVLPYENYHTFSNVWADFYYWNSTDEEWVYQYRSILGAANNIYPFGPGNYHNYFGVEIIWPVFLMPIGIDGHDMLDVLRFMMPMMQVDIVSGIGDNYISFINSTGPYNINFIWNESTGLVKLIYGFMTNPLTHKEDYYALFAKNMTNLQFGNNIFDLDNYFVPDIILTMNITTNSLGCEFYSAILDINPTNQSLPGGTGTPLFFGDMMINNHTLLAGNFTIEVKFLKIDLDDITLHLSGWFPSMGGWQILSVEEMNKMVSYNYVDNSVIVEMRGDYPLYHIGAWSYTLDPPGVFTLTSTAEDPDDDGDFILTWGPSYLATSYSVFEYTSIIDETNIHLTTPLAIGITNLLLPLENYTDGTYYFIVMAQNAHQSTLSNCIQVIVELPGPPRSFSLTSNAGAPDDDGIFTLTWGTADGAMNYSVYVYSSYITEINGSLTTLATDITSLSLPLTGYTNGTYYFIVVAHNAQGDTLSNCHKVTVEIPPEEPGDGDGDGGGIPGYPLYLLLSSFIVITMIIIKKKHGKLPKF